MINSIKAVNRLFILLVFVFIGCSSTKNVVSFIKGTPQEPKRVIALEEKDTFLPKEIRHSVSDSATEDFILANLKLKMPDSIPDTSLYSKDAPVFRPMSVDSGILLCERDLALYINDNAWRKYLQAETSARIDFERKYILLSIMAEDMYKDGLKELSGYYEGIYQSYKTERKHKLMWRNTFFVVFLIGIGFTASQTIN